MRKTYYVITILTIILLNQFMIKANDADGEYLFSVLNNEGFELIDCFDHIYLTKTNDEIIIRENSMIKLTIAEDYQAHYQLNKIMYLATNKTLYKIDLTNYQSEIILLPLPIIKQIDYYDNYFWFVGSKDDDGAIAKANKELVVENIYSMGGDGFECFDYLLWLNNKPIVLGHIKGYSYQGPFAHIGNEGDIKSFMSKLDRDFQISNTFYFNYLTAVEKITEAIVMDNYLYLSLSTKDNSYFYQFDYLLNPISHHALREKHPNALGLGGYHHYVHVYLINKVIYWQIEGEPWHDERMITTDKSLLSAKIEEGVLNVYALDETKVLKYQVQEHHIERLDPFTISLENAEVESLSNIVVASYFEPLIVKIKEITPYFSKLVSGTYDITYLIERSDKTSFTLSSQIIVPNYANVIDKGIYKNGHTLRFFGKATLNGQGVLNGYQINEEGEYQLTLTDCFGKKTNINFQIVLDYYQEEVSSLIEANYYLTQNEKLTLSIPLPVKEEVETLLINNEAYSNYEVKDDLLIINFVGKNKPSFDKYLIEKIIFKNNIVYVNQIVTIQTLKQLPQIDFTEKNTDNLTITGQINDPNQSIIGFETSLYLNNQLVKSIITPMKNNEIIIPVQKNKKYLIITKVLYEIGNGKVYESIIVEHEATFDKDIINYANISFKKTHPSTEVELAFQTSNSTIHHNLKVLSTNKTNSYQVKEDYQSLIISLIITGIVLAVIYFLNKVKRFKKKTS